MLAGGADDPVNTVIGMIGIVVKKNQLLGSAFHHNVDCLPPMAVSPAALIGLIFLGKILGRVLDSDTDEIRFVFSNRNMGTIAAEVVREQVELPSGRVLNIDDTDDLSRPAHTMLLGAGIPICEHMTNLAAVPALGGRLHAVPIAWVGGASFPVRAYVLA